MTETHEKPFFTYDNLVFVDDAGRKPHTYSRAMTQMEKALKAGHKIIFTQLTVNTVRIEFYD